MKYIDVGQSSMELKALSQNKVVCYLISQKMISHFLWTLLVCLLDLLLFQNFPVSLFLTHWCCCFFHILDFRSASCCSCVCHWFVFIWGSKPNLGKKADGKVINMGICEGFQIQMMGYKSGWNRSSMRTCWQKLQKYEKNLFSTKIISIPACGCQVPKVLSMRKSFSKLHPILFQPVEQGAFQPVFPSFSHFFLLASNRHSPLELYCNIHSDFKF